MTLLISVQQIVTQPKETKSTGRKEDCYLRPQKLAPLATSN